MCNPYLKAKLLGKERDKDVTKTIKFISHLLSYVYN